MILILQRLLDETRGIQEPKTDPSSIKPRTRQNSISAPPPASNNSREVTEQHRWKCQTGTGHGYHHLRNAPVHLAEHVIALGLIVLHEVVSLIWLCIPTRSLKDQCRRAAHKDRRHLRTCDMCTRASQHPTLLRSGQPKQRCRSSSGTSAGRVCSKRGHSQHKWNHEAGASQPN